MWEVTYYYCENGNRITLCTRTEENCRKSGEQSDLLEGIITNTATNYGLKIQECEIGDASCLVSSFSN